MGMTGDFSGLAKAAADFQALPNKVAKIAAAAAPKIAKLLAKEFVAGTDPDGGAWAALAISTRARGRSAPPLTDSGAMRGSVEVVGRGLEIYATVESPAEFHQGGTGSMPARPILPDDSLPATWDTAITAVAKRILPKGAL